MDQLSTIISWMTTNAGGVETALFYLMATLAIPFAYGVIFDRAIIRSGFLLIGMFGAVSGLFLVLQAQFLAMAQIMIYAVGITLVVVIALMLTNPRLENEMSPGVNKHSVVTFAIALVLFVTIYMSVRSEGWPVKSQEVAPNNVAILGKALMTDYSLPFEFSAVLLLAALVGAITLAKADPPPDPLDFDEDGGDDSAEEPAKALTTAR